MSRCYYRKMATLISFLSLLIMPHICLYSGKFEFAEYIIGRYVEAFEKNTRIITNRFMALEDVLFEFLHHEIVAYFNEKPGKDQNDVKELEFLGFACGYRIIERLTKDWPRFKEELDMMKFLCTDFWSSVYKRQVDNLRTNHQGVYVLMDNEFRFLSKISESSQYVECAPLYVTFTCGLIRGALANLGITCIVTAEVHSMPACKFHIEVQKS